MNRQVATLDPLDLAAFADATPMLGVEEIRAINPQRFEMEQLGGVCMVDEDRLLAVGYKDLGADGFWCDPAASGSMPTVVSVEVAAQLAVFYLKWSRLLDTDSDLGIGSLSRLQMFAPIRPPCRLVVAVRVIDLNAPDSARLEFQAVANGEAVYSGDMLCISLRNRGSQNNGCPAKVEYANSGALVGAACRSDSTKVYAPARIEL